MIPRLPLFGFVLLLAFYSASVRAQAFGESAVPATIQFGTENPSLKSLLQLQYEIQLLKKLIEHETSVNQIVDSSIQIGMTSPVIPAPDRELCAQVPANIPCAQAFNDLYENFSTSAESAPSTGSSLPPAALLADSGIPTLDAGALPELNAVALDSSRLYWTDITCLAQKCSAVISPDVTDPNARYRIIPGETLPDGSTIQAISATGVVIQRDKQVIHLEPAPQA
ncbi:MAG: hypothetical protein JWM96_165 [Alphaproteobacteria bacterium]|nr:hypothetical protein [Alphaproteobacteria bacterium]